MLGVICSVEWCERGVLAKGLCKRHYQQMRKYGKILPQEKRESELPGEKWKKLPGWDGRYYVSDKGRLKSVIFVKEIGQWRETIKIPSTRSNGYQCVVCYDAKKKKRKTYLIHRLVAEAFIPNPEGKPEVNHLDGNPKNNVVSNLEWATRKENERHAFFVLNRGPKRCRVRCVETGKVFESLNSAARSAGCCHPAVRKATRRFRESAGGYHWELVNKP